MIRAMCLVHSRHGTPAVALSGSAVNIAQLLVGRSADPCHNSGGGTLARDAPMFHVCSSSSFPLSAVVRAASSCQGSEPAKLIQFGFICVNVCCDIAFCAIITLLPTTPDGGFG